MPYIPPRQPVLPITSPPSAQDDGAEDKGVTTVEQDKDMTMQSSSSPFHPTSTTTASPRITSAIMEATHTQLLTPTAGLAERFGSSSLLTNSDDLTPVQQPRRPSPTDPVDSSSASTSSLSVGLGSAATSPRSAGTNTQPYAAATADVATDNLPELEADTHRSDALEIPAGESSLATSSSSSSLHSSDSGSDGPTPVTPGTSMGTPEEGVMVGSDSLARYREGLYAYTRDLYIQAQLAAERKSQYGKYSQFGLKASGMERLAAKKARARTLNE